MHGVSCGRCNIQRIFFFEGFRELEALDSSNNQWTSCDNCSFNDDRKLENSSFGKYEQPFGSCNDVRNLSSDCLFEKENENARCFDNHNRRSNFSSCYAFDISV